MPEGNFLEKYCCYGIFFLILTNLILFEDLDKFLYNKLRTDISLFMRDNMNLISYILQYENTLFGDGLMICTCQKTSINPYKIYCPGNV